MCHNIQYTISPSSLSTGTHSNSNSRYSTMVWFQGVPNARFWLASEFSTGSGWVEILDRFRWGWGLSSRQARVSLRVLARFRGGLRFLTGSGEVGVQVLARLLLASELLIGSGWGFSSHQAMVGLRVIDRLWWWSS